MFNTTVRDSVAAVKSALTIHLRWYQEDLKNDVYHEWQTYDNVLAVLPTGGGKTIFFGRVVYDHQHEPACVIAHRQELVTQISCALAAYGIKHKILASEKVIKHIKKQHVKKFKMVFVDPRSKIVVAGVDTLNARKRKLGDWAKTVKKWVIDEAHHILKENKWGKAVEMFPNAKGLGVSATPERADGKGLGRFWDGVFDQLCVGPSLLELIDDGWLTPYEVYSPDTNIDYSKFKYNKDGDIIDKEGLYLEEKKSNIVGDVAQHFNRLCPGKNGITFASNKKIAARYEQEFIDNGITAKFVHGETDDAVRTNTTEAFAEGKLKQMVNVDLFDEGYDVPSLYAVVMARRTGSFPKFNQQAGRALRPDFAPGMPLDTAEQRKAAIAAGPKPFAMIIDHVGNVRNHAVCREFKGKRVIDICYRDWTLAGRKSGKDEQDDDDLEIHGVTTCKSCFADYDLTLDECPYCSKKQVPKERKDPKVVKGDLTLLDPETLTQINKKIEDIQTAKPIKRMGNGIKMKVKRQQDERRAIQANLKTIIDWYGDRQSKLGRSESEIYRRFNREFGMDVLTAQTLTTKEMRELANRVALKVGRLTVDRAT